MSKQYEFLAVWRYVVKPQCVAEFERAYGPQGEWVRLFRRSDAYIKTELMRSGEAANQYMTIDHWESVDAFNEFKEANGAEYEELDNRMAGLTEREELVGYYIEERESGMGNRESEEELGREPGSEETDI